MRLGRLIEGTGANTPSPLPAAGSPAWQQWVITNLDPAAPTTFRRSTTLQCIKLLLQDISMEWRTAAGAVEERIRNGAAAPTETMEEVRAHIVSRLGWSRGPTIPPIRLHSLTVSQATTMLMRPIEMQRTALHADFAREAQQGGQATLPPSAPIDPNSVRAMQRRIWRTVRWERGQLEIMWRLPMDGVPLAGNSHLSSAPVEACGCGTFGGAHGASCSPRAHHFWECAVAQAVREQIDGAVPASINRRQLWLAEPPEGVQQAVWDVVVLAALSAIEDARRRLRAGYRAARQQGDTTNAVEDGAPSPLEVAKAEAVTGFWRRLHEFAGLGLPRKGWREVGVGHPLLAVQNGRIRVQQPEA